MKLRKISALALATVMTISTFAIFTSATDSTVQLPANLNGETKYATKTVVNFDEAEIESMISINSTDRTDMEIVSTGGASGKALKLISKNNTAELEIMLGEQDWSAYDGLLYYVDISDVTLKDGDTTTGTAVRVTSLMGTLGATRTDKELADGVEAFNPVIKAYYLDAQGTWQLCDDSRRNGERTQYPEDFAGWVYVPFSSFVSHKSWKMTGTGIPDAYAISKIMLMTGPYVNGQANIIIDDIQIVKLGMTNAELDEYLASQNPPADDNQTPSDDGNGDDGDETTDTEKADETTAAATEAATTEAETEASGGCGSSITGAFAVVAGVALAGTTVAVKKRRKED